MRPFVLALIGLSLGTSSGCALIWDGSRNVALSVAKPIEILLECKRNRRWAEDAWEQVSAQATCREASSTDYAAGFKEGYANYLFRGGNGEPPLVAPLHYRHIKYQTPGGYEAIQDWFHGYRHGAAMARDSGARKWITAAAASPALPPGEPHGPPLAPPLTVLPEQPRLEPPEPLPPPRAVPQPVPEVVPGPAPEAVPKGAKPPQESHLPQSPAGPAEDQRTLPAAAGFGVPLAPEGPRPAVLPPVSIDLNDPDTASPGAAPRKQEVLPLPVRVRILSIRSDAGPELFEPPAAPGPRRARILSIRTEGAAEQ
jgi:hypothetical protein